MKKENEVLSELRDKTFEGYDEELTFEPAMTLGTTLDDSIGILLTANEGADKMILQVGNERLMLGPEALLFLVKSVSILSSVVASSPKGSEFAKVIESGYKNDSDVTGVFCAYELEIADGVESWEIKVNEDTKAARTRVESARSVEMTEEKVQHHAEALDKLLESKEPETTSSEEDVPEKKILSKAEKQAKKLDVEGDYEETDEEEDFNDEDEEWIEEEDPEFDDEDDDSVEEDQNEEGVQTQDNEFLDRMKSLESTLTGAFEIREDEEPTFEKITKIKEKHGELAAREYVESLTQEQREELMRLRMEAKAKEEAEKNQPKS